MPGMNVVNLADIYAKSQQLEANDQAMQLQRMQMQEAMQGAQQKRSLRDLVSSSYVPGRPGEQFQTGGEEEFMGQPSLAGLTSTPPTRGRMDYDRLEQGLAKMGDFDSLVKAREARGGTKVSQAHQEKIKAAQGFVDAGDARGLEDFVRADDETPDDVRVAVNQDGSMSLMSASWPEPRTIGMSREMIATKSQSKYRDKIAKDGPPRKPNAIESKIAAIKSLNMDPEDEALAIQAIVGARAKPGGRDVEQMDAIAAYNAQYPMNPLTGKRPAGAPSFDQFNQARTQAPTPAQPPAQSRVTPEGYEILGQNPDGTLNIRDPKSGRTGKYKP